MKNLNTMEPASVFLYNRPPVPARQQIGMKSFCWDKRLLHVLCYAKDDAVLEYRDASN